jgi:amino acid transporter
MSRAFLREATGLVREARLHDVLLYNVAQINIGIGLAYMALFLPAFYPGSSLELASLITAIGVLPFAVVYALLSIAYPRSGSDYVFLTRVLPPLIGFTMSWNFVIWELFYVGWTGWAFPVLGVSPSLAILGIALNDQNLVSLSLTITQPTWTFVIGALSIIVFGMLLIVSPRAYFRFQASSAILAFASLILIGTLLGSSSHEAWVAKFNALLAPRNSSLEAINSEAINAGYTAAHPTSLGATLSSLAWPFLPLAITMMSCSFAGEIRNVKRSQLLGIVGALMLSALFFIVLSALLVRTIGYDSLGSLAYLYYVSPGSYPLPIAPWFHFLAALLTDNLFLLLVISIGMALWSAYWIPVILLYTVRSVLAWAFDRLAPDFLGEVSPRTHTPVKATAFCMAIGLVFLALVAFTPLLATLVGMLGLALTIMAVCIGGLAFPKTRGQDLMRPGVSWRLLGIPLISVCGALGLLFVAYMVYLFVSDSVVAANTPSNIMAVSLILIGGAVYYLVVSYYRKRKGVPLELVFKQIPPE